MRLELQSGSSFPDGEKLSSLAPMPIEPKSIEALLAGYEAFDSTEKGFVDRVTQWQRSGGLQTSSSSFAPGHVVASGWVVSPQANAVALIHHAKLGRWLQPGGHCEASDSTIAEAALREVREEIALSTTPTSAEFFDLDIHTIPARKGDPEHLHFDFRFLVLVDSVDLQAGSDAAAAAWVTGERLRTISEGDQGMKRMVLKSERRGLLRLGQRG